MKPTGYKKDVNAVAPLSMTEASNTIAEDNDNDRHPRQSFIYLIVYKVSNQMNILSYENMRNDFVFLF